MPGGEIKSPHSKACVVTKPRFSRSKPDVSDSATVLEAFKFIESAAAEFSDEDEDEDSEGRDKTILDLAAVRG